MPTPLLAVLPFLAACSRDMQYDWRALVGTRARPPAVSGDVLLTAQVQDMMGAVEMVALDRKGQEIWRRSAGDPTNAGVVLDPSGNPLFVDGDDLGALDAATGDVTWRMETGTSLGVAAVDGERIYIPGVTDNALLAIEGGEVLWRAPLEVQATSVVVGADGSVYAVGLGVTALERDGSVRWAVPFGMYTMFGAALTEHAVLVPVPSVGLVCLERADGTERWTRPSNMSLSPSVGPDGTIYAPNVAFLDALDPDGGLRWQTDFRTGEVAVGADGLLYTLALLPMGSDTGGGRSWQAVSLDPDDGDVTWQSTTEDLQGPNGAPTLDHHDAFYATGVETWLYAFSRASNLADGPWPRPGADNTNASKER